MTELDQPGELVNDEPDDEAAPDVKTDPVPETEPTEETPSGTEPADG